MNFFLIYYTIYRNKNKRTDKKKGNKKKENYNTNAYNPAHFFKHIIYEASFEQDEQVY